MDRNIIDEVMADLAKVLDEIRDAARLSGNPLYLPADQACLLRDRLAQLLAGIRSKPTPDLLVPRGSRAFMFEEDDPA